MIKQTLMHELAHAFMFEYGFNGVELNEEILCDFISIYSEKIISISNKILKQRKEK